MPSDIVLLRVLLTKHSEDECGYTIAWLGMSWCCGSIGCICRWEYTITWCDMSWHCGNIGCTGRGDAYWQWGVWK